MFLFTEGGHSIPVVDPVSAADAGGVFGLLWLVIGLPLLGATVLLLGGRRTDPWGHLLGTAIGPEIAFTPWGSNNESKATCVLGIICAVLNTHHWRRLVQRLKPQLSLRK